MDANSPLWPASLGSRSKTPSWSNSSPATSQHPSSGSLHRCMGAVDIPDMDLDYSKDLDPTCSSVASSVPSEFEHEEDEVIQPPNFDQINPGLYRSSFPRVQHFSFLRSLGLKTVLGFTQDEYPQVNRDFFAEEGITFVQIGMPGNKEETIKVDPARIEEALKVVTDPQNYPLLMHCNKGRHRTGCVVGCLRKLQNWPIEQILEEYCRFSAPKSRPMDQQCIRLFSVQMVWEYVKDRQRPLWLQGTYRADLYQDANGVSLRQELSTSTVCLPDSQALSTPSSISADDASVPSSPPR